MLASSAGWAARLVVVALLSFLMAPSAAAQDCIDYRATFAWQGGVGLPHWAHDAEKRGRYLVLRLGDKRVAVIDMIDPLHPSVVAEAGPPAAPAAAAARGDFDLIAINDAWKIWLVDIADPLHPAYVSFVPTAGPQYTAAEVHGGYLYTSYIGSSGMEVFDLSDPVVPERIHTAPLPSSAGWIVPHDDLLLYCGARELFLFDNSDPAAPSQVASLPFPGFAADFVATDSYVFVAAGDGGLHIIDVAEPSAPVIVTSLPPTGGNRPQGLAVEGSTLFVTQANNSHWSTQVFDIRDPTAPQYLKSLPNTSYHSPVAAGEFLVALVLHTRALRVVDWVRASAPSFPLGTAYMSSVNDVATSGRLAYVTGPGLFVVDVSDARNPRWVGEDRQIPTVRGVAVQGARAYYGFDSGLVVSSLDDPIRPRALGWCSVGAPVDGVAVSGSLAALSAGAAGVALADVSGPEDPTFLSRYDTPGRVVGSKSLALHGNTLYVADSSSVLILDLTDPSSPVALASIATPGNARAICATPLLLYVADDMAGLTVIDAGDPMAPQVVASLSLGAPAFDVVVEGQVAYVAATELLAVDIANPRVPTLMGSCLVPWVATQRIALADGVVVNGLGQGVMTFPTQCRPTPIGPRAPALTAVPDGVLVQWQSPAGLEAALYNVYRSESIAFPGVRLTRDAIPSHSKLEYLDRDVQTDTMYFYRVGAQRGVLPEEISEAAAVTARLATRSAFLGPAHPSPFDRETRVPFRVVREGRVRISVFESGGRLVRKLTDARWAPGAHFVTWDGRGDDGARTAGGVYFVRYEQFGETMEQKVVLLR